MALLLYLLYELFYWIPFIGKYLSRLKYSFYDIAFLPIAILMPLQAWLFRDKVIIKENSFFINNPKYNRQIKYTDIEKLEISQIGMNIICNIKLLDEEINLINCDKWEELKKVFIKNNIAINNHL